MASSSGLGVRTCTIHCSDIKPGDSIKPFTEELLRKCVTAQKVRSFNRLQYADFNIPSQVGGNSGYHSACYKKFTAIKKQYYDKVPSLLLKLPSSSQLSTVQAVPAKNIRTKREKVITSSGVLKKICLFCGKKRKKHRQKEQQLLLATNAVENQVVKAAASLDDRRILTIIDQGDFVAKEVRYHSICMKNYLAKARGRRPTDPVGNQPTTSFSHSKGKLNEEGFNFVFGVVESEILLNEKVLTLTELHKLFKDKIQSIQPNLSESVIRPQYLENKLLNRFQSSVLVDKSTKDHIFFKSTMNFIPSVVESKLHEQKRSSLLRDAAYTLRKEIITADFHPLPSRELSLVDLYKGECEIPNELRKFMADLIYGPSTSKDSVSRNRRIDSICSDIIFTTSNGRTMPPKQLILGSATKTITGSKKIVNILNRLGHCVSYNAVEEIETELSYSSHKTDSLVPYPIQKSPNLFTSTAFNNFDRFVETPSGKNTLHDTVGIIFQNKTDGDSMEVEIIPDALQKEDRECDGSGSSKPAQIRKRRAFEEIISELQPYMKKPKLKHLHALTNPQSEIAPPKNFQPLDIIWALNFIHRGDSPMWVGFNSQLFVDQSPQQTLAYLPQVNSSPTSYAVVRHTLKMAEQIMEECGQSQIFCTYDLNIAKMALEIQSYDQPEFDRIFIGLGPFHIEMAMFKALGKYVDGSGIVEVLVESGILAAGSTLGFIGGTNYNRCKRIHRIFALSLQKLHYDLFLSKEENTDISDKLDVPKLVAEATAQPLLALNDLVLDEELKSHIEKYVEFEKQTALGNHGLTAQIWMIYVHFMDLYNNFNRSIRMGDIFLFVNSLLQITDLFFIMNHQNYSRWLVAFTDNIIKALQTDSHIALQLKKGLFSVKRTPKSFSRTPVDLTLEQTINADAANKLGGIISASNSISARQRWAYSHSQRTEVVSHLLDAVGITVKEDTTRDLKKGRIARDHHDFTKILQTFNGMVNPFDKTLEPSLLFHLCTGKSASQNVSDFLKEVPTVGQEQHSKFRAECSEDVTRFYRPIRRNEILNFVADRPKITISRATKTQTLKMERNLFCRLLTLSLKQKIDLQSVLRFPLTPVPLSLGHPDGTLVKTQKSVMLRYLESLTSHEPPTSTDVLIVDGFHLLHQLGNSLPATYGGIANAILKKINATSNASCIHVIFDRYVSPSIKDLERDARTANIAGGSNVTYHVTKADQRRPMDMVKALTTIEFKQSLVNFLINEWSSDHYAQFFTQFALYVNREETCYFYYSLTGESVTVHEDECLKSGHIEADSRMVYHLTTLKEAANVVIRTCDTDVLIIALGNLHNIKHGVKIWLEVGSLSRNDHRFINLMKIYDTLGPEMCRALPALHAITGSDYTSAFFRVGKKKPVNIVSANEKFKQALSNFANTHVLTAAEFHIIEQFVCQLYSRSTFQDIDELRLHLFMDAYKRNCDRDPLKPPKGIDSTNLPPCRKVLWQHVLRAKFVTLMWTELHLPNPPTINETEYGWIEKDRSYAIKWYDGPALPETLEEIVLEEVPENEDEVEDGGEVTDQSSDDDGDC